MAAADSEPDPVWNIADIPVLGIAGSEPAFGAGSAGSYRFWITPDQRDSEIATTDHLTRYDEFRDYGRIANKDPYPVATGLDASGTPWFREQHDRTVVETLVVAVEPPSGSTGRPIWGLITGVEDETTYPDQACVLSVEVLFLAPLAAYADAGRLRQALEADGI